MTPSTEVAISAASFAVYLFGPMLGPYALIFFASLAGALWPLTSSQDALTKWQGIGLLFRCVLMALSLTGSAAAVLAHYYKIDASELLAPVAFLIGALGNGWRPVLESIAEAAKMLISRFSREKQITPP